MSTENDMGVVMPGPTGREEILEFIMEEARRAERGEMPACAGCRRTIGRIASLYRCTECGMPFHLHCIRAHFARHTSRPDTRDKVCVSREDARHIDGFLGELAESLQTKRSRRGSLARITELRQALSQSEGAGRG